jgi:hypothetical protein
MTEENKQKPNKPQPKKTQPKKPQPWYIEPSASVSQFGDNVIEPKRTDTKKNITIGKGDKFKINLNMTAYLFQDLQEKTYKESTKQNQVLLILQGRKRINWRKSCNIGARWTFGGKKKGGLIKGHPKLAKKGWK